MSGGDLSGMAEAATDTTTINRGIVLPTRSEDASVINCREIEDWCSQCREHRAPILTASAGLIGSFGLFVGFLSGLASTNRPGWHALFLGGTVATALAMVACGAALTVAHVPAVRKKLRRGDPPVTPLDRLADHMDRAMKHNRVPAGQAIDVGISVADNEAIE